jgi:hypothetical protein
MHDQLQMVGNSEEHLVLHLADAMAIPTDEWYESACKLDGSIDAMGKCLNVLMKLTCQDINEHSVPVLELRFGEILTMTSLLTIDGRGYLSITAFIPRPTGDVLQSTAHLAKSATIEGDTTILWHANDGCYVIVRKLPISVFWDERSVLDAIADASDEAMAWQAAISIDALEK